MYCAKPSRVLDLLAGAMTVAFLVGGVACTPTEGEDTPDPVTIKLAGSTTVNEIMAVAVPAYMKLYPHVTIETVLSTTGGGITAAGKGEADIGMASRAMKSSEKTEYADLVETAIARDGIAVIVHTSNPVASLTFEQLKIIYSGHDAAGDTVSPAWTHWSQAGVASFDHDFVLFARPEGGGTRDFFTSTALGGDASLVDGVTITDAIQEVRDGVAGAAGGLGYVGSGQLDSTVKAVPIAVDSASTAVVPSDATVKDGSYPVSRGLFVVTKGEATGEVKKFIEYLLSSPGQTHVVAVGYTSVR